MKGRLTFLMVPRSTALVLLVGQGKVLTHKIVRAAALILEAVQLGEYQQPLHDHPLEPCFHEAEVVDAGKTCSYARRWRRCKDVDGSRSPVDQTVWANGVCLQREIAKGFGHHDPGDAIRIGI